MSELIDMCTKNSPIPPERSPLLRPQSEKPVFDIRETERSTPYNDKDYLASQRKFFNCAVCERALSSKAGKVKHERSCVRKDIKKKRQRLFQKKSRKPMIFTCKQCEKQFMKRKPYNEHLKEHVTLIECQFCKKSYEEGMSFEYHEAICDGRHYDSNEVNCPPHRTRSQSRLTCTTPARSQSCNMICYNGSGRLSQQFERSNSHISRKRKKFNHSDTRLLKKKRRRGYSWSSRYVSDDSSDEDVSDLDDYDDFDDDFDHHINNQLVNNYERNVLSYNNRSMTPFRDPEYAASRDPEYAASPYPCTKEECSETFASLKWATIHEMKEHNMLPLFACRECRNLFTSRYNLWLHRKNSHPDVLTCVLCDNRNYGETIQEHVFMHEKYSLKCEVCSKQFLGKGYLDAHIKEEGRLHKTYRKTKAKILERVDRRETTITFVLPIKLSPIKVTSFDTDSVLNTDLSSFGSRTLVDNLPWRT